MESGMPETLPPFDLDKEALVYTWILFGITIRSNIYSSFSMKGGLAHCMIGVLVYPGATQLVRILSFAHSQAKFLVS